jgi:hypothetical protein
MRERFDTVTNFWGWNCFELVGKMHGVKFGDTPVSL